MAPSSASNVDYRPQEDGEEEEVVTAMVFEVNFTSTLLDVYLCSLSCGQIKIYINHIWNIFNSSLTFSFFSSLSSVIVILIPVCCLFCVLSDGSLNISVGKFP